MKLNTLLEEIKYGKELVESKGTVNDLQDFLDEDYNILLVSKRADQLLRECDISQPFVKKLARAVRNYKEYENKILEGKSPSTIYARMKVDSITEDINSAILEFGDVKRLRDSNQVNIAKVIATLKYGIKTISEEKNVPLRGISKCSQIVETYINKEFSFIENIV